jgi:GTPase SAR1 family protein
MSTIHPWLVIAAFAVLTVTISSYLPFQTQTPSYPFVEDDCMTSIIAESKVGMLGHTASGKTCFMYGMYYAFSIFETKLPFTLHNEDEREDAMMREIWEQIEDGFRPPGNDVDIITYKFQLRGDLNRPLIDIAWIDYRGGALQAQPTQEEERALRDQLVGSDCLFLCVESKTLQSDKAKDRNKIGRFGTLTKDLPTVPLVILVTKADEFDFSGQVPGSARAEAKPPASGSGPTPLPAIDPMIEDLVRGKFYPWFEQDRSIMICPVTIMGQNRYFRYLPAPFAFTAFKIVQKKHTEKSELLKLSDADLKYRTEGTGRYLHYFNQGASNKLRERIREEKETLADLERRMASLDGYFSEASIFQKQERVDLHGKRQQARK